MVPQIDCAYAGDVTNTELAPGRPLGDVLSSDDRASFDRDGYVVINDFLRAGQVEALCDTVAHDDALHRRAYGVGDGTGDAVELALWNAPGDDPFGMLARNERLVAAATQLLGDEVYHYHSKLNSKRPGGGGTWVWHQDYGYWYENGCLFPDMLTAGVPLSPMNEVSGGLEVIPGSHRAGRLSHWRIGGQTGADPDRVSFLVDRLGSTLVEAEPGDVVLFHCNTLHTSAPNRSDVARDLLLVAYNTRDNDPAIDHHHPRYTPLAVVADDAIEARRGHYEGERRTYMVSRADRSADAFDRIDDRTTQGNRP